MIYNHFNSKLASGNPRRFQGKEFRSSSGIFGGFMGSGMGFTLYRDFPLVKGDDFPVETIIYGFRSRPEAVIICPDDLLISFLASSFSIICNMVRS